MKEPLRSWAAAADAQGWRSRRGGKHDLVLYPPGGGLPITFPTSGHRRGKALANLRATLRRNGLNIP